MVSDGFKEFELIDVRRNLRQIGGATFVVGTTKDKVTGRNPAGGEAEVPVDIPLEKAMAQDFHALLLPGGSENVQNLSRRPEAIQFVKDFMIGRKPLAAIGEAAAILLRAGNLSGRTLTADASLADELKGAGAIYVDTNVVRDGNLITARGLNDVPALEVEFTRILAELRAHSGEMRKIA